jgi:hypothetical protein
MRFILIFAMAGTLLASAECQTASSVNDADNPVEQVRANKSWEFGPFVNGGVGTGNRDNFYFFRAGFQLGKVISRELHPWPFPGQFEFGGNIMPLWQAYTPPHNCNPARSSLAGEHFEASVLPR